MKDYKFEKDGNIYRWANDYVKVEFTDPHIQTHREVVELTDPKDIMYFYYNVDVYHKNYNDEWEPMLQKYVYDFPALFVLIEMLDRCLNKNENNLSCKDSFVEDFYEIEHYKMSDGQRYTLVIGATPDGHYHTITKSVALEFLTKDELEEFSKTVKAFLEYAMKSYSECAKNREAFDRQNKIIKNGKLYVYELDRDGQKYLDSMILANDRIRDLDIFVPTKDGKTFCEEEHLNLIVEKFDETNQIVFFDNGVAYKCSEIANIFTDEPTDKLQYGIPEIVQDFYGILSTAEKQDFKNETEDVLFKKYCWTIINRSWMCRDEHNFDKKYPELLNIKDTGNHERVFEVVRMVIRELKKIC